MNFLELAKILLSLLPLLIEAIKKVEEAFPQGHGAEKLAIVKNVLETANEYSGSLEQIGEIWNPLEKIIGGIVSTFNDAGVFKK